jgi:hypothetical protein
MVIRANVEESKMKDSRQFFSTSPSPSHDNTNDNPLAVKVGDIVKKNKRSITYTKDKARDIGIVVRVKEFDAGNKKSNLFFVYWLTQGENQHLFAYEETELELVSRVQQ